MKDDHKYLLDIAECIQRVEEYTQGGRNEFMQTRLVQDAVARNFEIIGEAANRISAKLKEERPSVPWRDIVQLRNLLIHDYGRVSIELIWQIVEQDIPRFKRSVEDMLRERQ